jgi:hypothetical protein
MDLEQNGREMDAGETSRRGQSDAEKRRDGGQQKDRREAVHKA